MLKFKCVFFSLPLMFLIENRYVLFYFGGGAAADLKTCPFIKFQTNLSVIYFMPIKTTGGIVILMRI